jgi:NDP-sugar pyrophosphorylase family protein
VLCTGHQAHLIENALGDGAAWDVTIQYSREPQPLRTAGAVKFAEPFLRDVSDFLVMNGDSFMEIDFRMLMNSHRHSGAMVTMAVLQMKNEMRYGTVQVDDADRVIGFAEKTTADSRGFVNAGIYVFNRRIFDYIPKGESSLEKDIFPNILQYGMRVSRQEGVFIDIGTPEDYARAQNLSERLYEVACRPSRHAALVRKDTSVRRMDETDD